jgi:hypothetical protein
VVSTETGILRIHCAASDRCRWHSCPGVGRHRIESRDGPPAAGRNKGASAERRLPVSPLDQS